MKSIMKKLFFSIFVLLAFAPLFAVAKKSKINWNDELSIASAIEITHDEFKKITTFEGPNIAKGDFDYLMLRAFKSDKSGELIFQVFVHDSYSGQWRFYDSAYDSNGNKLDFKSIRRNVVHCGSIGGCSYSEDMSVLVTEEYLQANAESGIRFKITGKSGEEIFEINPFYIKAFLRKISSQ